MFPPSDSLTRPLVTLQTMDVPFNVRLWKPCRECTSGCLGTQRCLVRATSAAPPSSSSCPYMEVLRSSSQKSCYARSRYQVDQSLNAPPFPLPAARVRLPRVPVPERGSRPPSKRFLRLVRRSERGPSGGRAAEQYVEHGRDGPAALLAGGPGGGDPSDGGGTGGATGRLRPAGLQKV